MLWGYVRRQTQHRATIAVSDQCLVPNVNVQGVRYHRYNPVKLVSGKIAEKIGIK